MKVHAQGSQRGKEEGGGRRDEKVSWGVFGAHETNVHEMVAHEMDAPGMVAQEEGDEGRGGVNSSEEVAWLTQVKEVGSRTWNLQYMESQTCL